MIPTRRAGVFACVECGTEFLIGSRFCHVCGSQRQPKAGNNGWNGLPALVPVVAAILGISCLLMAFFAGHMPKVEQAVQTGPIDWTLRALAWFVFGLLANGLLQKKLR